MTTSKLNHVWHAIIKYFSLVHIEVVLARNMERFPCILSLHCSMWQVQAEWTSSWVSKWVSGWIHDSLNAWVIECMNEWFRARMTDWLIDRVTEGGRASKNEWARYRFPLGEWGSDWMNRVSLCVCVWINNSVNGRIRQGVKEHGWKSIAGGSGSEWDRVGERKAQRAWVSAVRACVNEWVSEWMTATCKPGPW